MAAYPTHSLHLVPKISVVHASSSRRVGGWGRGKGVFGDGRAHASHHSPDLLARNLACYVVGSESPERRVTERSSRCNLRARNVLSLLGQLSPCRLYGIAETTGNSMVSAGPNNGGPARRMRKRVIFVATPGVLSVPTHRLHIVPDT